MQLLLIFLLVLTAATAVVSQLGASQSPPLLQGNACHISSFPMTKRPTFPQENHSEAIVFRVQQASFSIKQSISSDKQLHQGKRLQDESALRPLRKCRRLSEKGPQQRQNGGVDQEQFCYVSKQEFISKEQIISSLQVGSTEDISDSNKYVWVALICAGIVGAYFYYKMRVGLLLEVLAEVELKADIKSTEYEQRLSELNQLKKIYEIYWDRVVYHNEVDLCYDHTVYEGRFLTQDTYVYAVRLENADVGTLQHKLSKLLNCSHRRLAKLFYYTKTPQFMLIFTQKITPLSFKDLNQHFSKQTSLTAKKNAIEDIIETLSYLQEKIELKLLPLESIQMDILASSQRSSNDYYDYKINTIPCLFRKMNYHCSQEDFDTASEDSPICLVRMNIVSLFHLILLNGKLFDKHEFNKLVKQGQYSNEEYIQFLDFILYEAKAIGHTHELLFKEVLEHPFLWDGKRKILFLADFSNYIETHLDDFRLSRLEKHAKEHRVIKQNWIKQFHSVFASEVNFYRKYDFESVRDLIRMIRNKLNHFHEIPKDVKAHIGKTPQGFIEYCFSIFPKLLPFAYIYTRKKKWKLHMK